MKPQELHVDVAIDIIRINYECPSCGTSYTERQYQRESDPVCGHCIQRLEKITLVIARREPA